MSNNRARAAGIFNDHPGYVAGLWFTLSQTIETTAAALAANTMRLYPFVAPNTVTLDKLGFRQGAIGIAGNIQGAIYASDPATNLPTGTALSSTSSISTAGSSVNVNAALSAPVRLVEGQLYWLGSNADNATAVFVPVGNGNGLHAWMIGSTAQSDNSAGGTATWLGYSIAQTFGTWPDVTANTEASYAKVQTAIIPVIQGHVSSVP